MSETDDLIIELQTKLSFQDDLLEGLNQVVTSQQQQIMHLETAFKALKLQVKTLQTDPNQTEVSEPPPPHY
jgi:SlyX protein